MRPSMIGCLILPILVIFFYLSFLRPMAPVGPDDPSLQEQHLIERSKEDKDKVVPSKKEEKKKPTNNPFKNYVPNSKLWPAETNRTRIDYRTTNFSLADLYNEMEFDDSHMEESVWKPYTEFHRNMLRADPSKQRLAIFRCSGGCGGFGDRISGALAVFWYAILTDRAYIIDWNSPFEFTEFFDSPRINWKFQRGMAIDAASFSFIDYSPADISSMTSNNLVIRTNGFNLNFGAWRQKNLVSRAAKLGFTRSNRHNFRLLINYLFKPQPFVQEAIDKFRSKSGWIMKETKVIGIQIRTGSGVHEGERVSPAGVKLIFQCASKVTQHFFKGYPVKWYLTTDSYKVEEEAQKEFGDRIILFKGKISHTDKGGGDKEAALKTTADWWILGETDFNIISRSMFGWTASWKSGHPWLIGDGKCRLGVRAGDEEFDVVLDSPFPLPPRCGQGQYEKCHIPPDMKVDPNIDWDIGDSLA